MLAHNTNDILEEHIGMRETNCLLRYIYHTINKLVIIAPTVKLVYQSFNN